MATTLTNPVAADTLHQFRLVTGGRVLTEARLLAASISTRVNRIPTALVHLMDGDSSTQTFEQSMLPALGLGARLSIEAGYGDALETVFEGLVVAQSIKARGSKASVLVLELQHVAIHLARGRRSQLYLSMNEAQLANAIAQRHPGLEINWPGEVGPAAEKVAQFNASDWDFLVSRAEARGRVVLVEGQQIRIVPPQITGATTRELVFGQDIYDFEAGQDSRFAYAQVEANTWDFEQQKVVALRAGDSPEGNNGDSHALHYTGHLPVSEWRDWLDGVQTRMELSRLRGHFVIKGDANLQVGNRVALRGFGDQFDKVAYVSGLIHKLDGGDWRTDVEVGLLPESFAKYHDVLDEPVSGLIPAIRGLVIGVVKGIIDQAGHHRIELIIPSLDPERHLLARLAQPEAGKGRGAFFFPQIGDEVVVGFLEEDPNNPIVLGSLYSAKQTPPFDHNDKGPQAHKHRGLLSPEGLRLEFDDATQTITVETPEGLQVRLGDKSIRLQRGADSIEMKEGECNISIQGDLNIRANQINLDGVARVQVGAPVIQLDDSTQGKLSLQGGIATLDGTAIFIG